MFMAAIPLLPTPHPTNIPSTTVSNDQLTIPNSVGIKIFLKSRGILTVPKSISSLPDIKVKPLFYTRNLFFINIAKITLNTDK